MRYNDAILGSVIGYFSYDLLFLRTPFSRNSIHVDTLHS